MDPQTLAALSKAAGALAPAIAQSAAPPIAGRSGGDPFFSSMFDASGWNVNFGPGNISAQRTSSPPAALNAAQWPASTWAMLGAGALVLVLLVKKMKK